MTQHIARPTDYVPADCLTVAAEQDGSAAKFRAQHQTLASAFAAATDGHLPTLRPWHLPAAHLAASPASSSAASLDGDPGKGGRRDTRSAVGSKPAAPSPGQTRADSALSGFLSPSRSAEASGDFARLLSLDLSPSGRVLGSPARRAKAAISSAEPSGAVRTHAISGSGGGYAEARAATGSQPGSRDVTVRLHLHPDDIYSWGAVELITAAQTLRGSASERGVDDCQASLDGASPQQGSSPAEGRGRHQTQGVGCRPRADNASADQAEKTAPSAAGASAEADEDAPEADDWVAALPVVPKLPIKLPPTAPSAAAAEPSYADLTAQLAGSSTSGSDSRSEGSSDTGSPSAGSEEEECSPRDPRRELELDMAVAEALAQVLDCGYLSSCAPRIIRCI